MEESSDKELLVREVAQRLKMSDRQVLNLFYDGKLRGRKISEKKTVIYESSLEVYQKKINEEIGVGRRHLTLF